MADATQKDNPMHRDPERRKVIIFNGPPGSGKDTGSEALRSFVQIHAPYLKPTHMKFSEPLKRAAHALYAVFHNWDYYDTKEGAPYKNMSSGDFLGLSPREAYIEMFRKLAELHDERALGFVMRKRIVRNNFNSVVICSDGGRLADLEPVINLVGQRNILVVEVHATGITWDRDIRHYIGAEVQEKFPHVQVIKLPNTIGTREDKELFKMLCQGVAKKFLGIEEREGV